MENLLLCWGLVSVTKMSTVGKIQAHQSIMRLHDGLVDLEISRAAAKTLYIDTPFLRVQLKRFEGASLACQLNSINVLVASVVSCSRVPLAVLVAHGRSQSIEDCTGSKVLRSNKYNRFALALNFIVLLTASID